MPSTFEGAGAQPGPVQEPARNGAPDVAQAPAQPTENGDAGLVVDELLVEDISIDGMCGVY